MTSRGHIHGLSHGPISFREWSHKLSIYGSEELHGSRSLSEHSPEEGVCDAEHREGGDVGSTAAATKAAVLSLHRRELHVFMSQANRRLNGSD